MAGWRCRSACRRIGSIRLRWLAALGVLSVGLAARYLTPVRFDIRGVYIVAAAIALYNGALYMLARQRVWDRAPEQAIPASRHVIGFFERF